MKAALILLLWMSLLHTAQAFFFDEMWNFVVALICLLSLGTICPKEPGPPSEREKLVANDGAADDQFGISVAISEGTIVVGSPLDDDNGQNSGSAYVFVQSGSLWSQQAKLLASDGAADDNFGYSVAISQGTVVVGSPLDDGSGDVSGSAYVFVQSGSLWSQQAKLLASDGAVQDRFGLSVAISQGTIVVGSPFDDDNGDLSGSAYVFVQSGSLWSQQTKLLASDGAANEVFGNSVAISQGTIVVVALGDAINGPLSGSAYVFVQSGSLWSQQTKLLASGGAAYDYFGRSLAISEGTIVVGAPYDDDNGPLSGSAYVFAQSGSLWSQQAKLLASGGAADEYFGYSVAISEGTIVVGVNLDDDNGPLSGSAYVFAQSGSLWSQQAKLLAGDGAAYDTFGISVAISQDIIVVGANWDDDNGQDSGSAYVFE